MFIAKKLSTLAV